MRSANRILCSCLTIVAFATSGISHADDSKIGSFETNFAERSPLSELKSLTKRLKVLGPGEKLESLQDYDLAKEGFWVYVPEKYDPAKPMGLIVLALYKHADSLPTPILSQLADANVALVVPKEYLDTWWKRGGLMLDAAYNMQKLYKIDPKRVYIFGSQDWADADGKDTRSGTYGIVLPRSVYWDVYTLSSNALSADANGKSDLSARDSKAGNGERFTWREHILLSLDCR